MLFLPAVISFIGNAYISGSVILGIRKMVQVKDIPLLRGGQLPKVSVVIPACNEEETIKPALKSVLELDYPDFEVIVINDRSTDNTSSVLEDMKERYPELKVYNISELPPGWLGKNHALQFGAAKAQGEYILFTDADIVMEKTVLSRTMLHVLTYGLDHLSMIFSSTARGGLLNALLMEIGSGLLFYFRPWKVKDPASKSFIGVGAFNLVKAQTYRAIGGHHSIALQPVDDVMLGRIIKRNGYAQDCLLGQDLLQVKWYRSVRDLIEGLMKNIFAAFEFRLDKVLVGLLFIFIINILPIWGVIFTSGWTAYFFLTAVLIRLISFAKGLKESHLPIRYTPWSLITPYVHSYIIIKATVTTLVNRGITWRGTFYSLADLKRQEKD